MMITNNYIENYKNMKVVIYRRLWTLKKHYPKKKKKHLKWCSKIIQNHDWQFQFQSFCFISNCFGIGIDHLQYKHMSIGDNMCSSNKMIRFQTHTAVITSTTELLYWPGFVCLFVCLPVHDQHNSKKQWICFYEIFRQLIKILEWSNTPSGNGFLRIP